MKLVPMWLKAAVVVLIVALIVFVIANKMFAFHCLLIGGILVFGWEAVKSSQSNSTTQVNSGSPSVHIEDNTGNVPLLHQPFFWFAVVCAAAEIYMVIYAITSK